MHVRWVHQCNEVGLKINEVVSFPVRDFHSRKRKKNRNWRRNHQASEWKMMTLNFGKQMLLHLGITEVVRAWLWNKNGDDVMKRERERTWLKCSASFLWPLWLWYWVVIYSMDNFRPERKKTDFEIKILHNELFGGNMQIEHVFLPRKNNFPR